MYYNLKGIIKYLEPFHTDKYGRFYEEMAEDYVGRIPDEYCCSYNTGISKCVIIPEEFNYVIKIPYTGYYDEEEEVVNFNEDAFYHPFFCYGDFIWDSCAYEEDLYNKAKELGFKLFFLPIKKVGEWKKYPIYIQPKANSLWHENRNSYKKLEKPSKEIKTRLSNSKIKIQSDSVARWFEEVLVNTTEEKFDKFLEFLKNKEIDKDLHEGNVGHYMGIPVIIDYAGFTEDSTYNLSF